MSRNIIPIPPGLIPGIPSLGVVNLVRQKDGSLIPMLRTWKPEVQLTKDIPSKLGLELSWRNLRIAVRAGFIISRRPAPRVTLIRIDSLMNYLEESADPEFWTPQRTHEWELAAREES
ncbi:hypothetical protein HNR46_001321 [Haloferula luteola]|uniref:Uncharacterized protein n=1 Tax=Haloferula luteola TaxID=595692 RepID=A0A840UY62_9BACT|nr:hypothetical protein [Haloferula luteola]MBB5351087.1 hypothetical protein [Haloferula luteola]